MGFPLQICIIHSLSQYILAGCPQSLGKLKPSQACCCLQNSSVGCLGLVPLHVRSPHTGLADLERNISPLSQSAQLTLPFMHPLVPLVWRHVTDHGSSQEPWSVTPCVVLSFLTLPLPFLTETSSSVRVYCSVTKP